MSFHGRYPRHYIDEAVWDCQARHAPKRWDDFIIPNEVLRLPPKTTKGKSQSSALVRLPPELLLMIFEHACPLSKVCLALACKHLLQISRLAKITIPSSASHRRLRAKADCLAMRSLLHLVGPVNRRSGLPSKTLAVCCYCYRLRPTRKGYWRRIRKEFPSQLITLNMVDYRIQSWGNHSSIECPECLLKEKLNALTDYQAKNS